MIRPHIQLRGEGKRGREREGEGRERERGGGGKEGNKIINYHVTIVLGNG